MDVSPLTGGAPPGVDVGEGRVAVGNGLGEGVGGLVGVGVGVEQAANNKITTKQVRRFITLTPGKQLAPGWIL
jgi:hypothetical protein